MQGSARKDVVFEAARVYTFTVPGPKWKSWLRNRTPSRRFLPALKSPQPVLTPSIR